MKLITNSIGNDDKIKELKEDLTTILEEDLGVYEYIQDGIVLSTTPSIYVIPPDLPSYFRMKLESGIECLINRTPEASYTQMGAGRKKGNFKINLLLNQFDRTKSLSLPIEKIMRYYHATKCYIKPFENTKEGVNIEQAFITIPMWRYYSKIEV